MDEQRLLDDVLDPTFTMAAVMNGEVAVFTREAYLGGIEAKKFGGMDKTPTVDRVDVHRDIASVTLRLEGEAIAFHHFLTLARPSDDWHVVHSTVHMLKK